MDNEWMTLLIFEAFFNLVSGKPEHGECIVGIKRRSSQLKSSLTVHYTTTADLKLNT